ncbi:MAG: DNA polymerase I [bacterium]
MHLRIKVEKLKKKLYLVDGSSFLYRAYFALPYLSTKKGLPTRVVFGFLKMLNKIITEHNPDYLGIVFDPKGPTFRHEMLKEYKIKRPPMPHEIVLQFPYILRLLDVMSIKTIIKDGYEADDVIASISYEFKDELSVVVVTSDKDLYQLTDNEITVWHPQKDKFIDKDTVKELLGVYPSQLTDYLALCGDAVDGIPGVKGIGEKTALKLISEYGSLEKIYENIDKIPERLQKLLSEGKEIAFLSRKLCELRHEKIGINLGEMKIREWNKEGVLALLKELEFYDIIKEMGLGEINDFSIPLIENYRGFDIRGQDVYIAVHSQSEENKVLLFTDDGKKIYRVVSNLKGFFDKVKDKRCYTADGKNLLKVQLKERIDSFNFYDLSLASYLINSAANHSHTLEDIFRDVYGFTPDNIKSNIVSLFPQDENEKKVAFLLKNLPNISQKIFNKLNKDNELLWLYNEIEKPLSEILVKMENWGVKVNGELFQEISTDLKKRLDEMEREIFSLTGESFNINSPKQLATILYEKLGLKPVKKGKKSLSTAADVLDDLYESHPVIPLLLEYRNLAKIKNTYLDVLPSYIGKDGRIHTTFNQTLTATGRLSSSNPNLQNIPIKYEWGEKLRKAFIADDGYFLVSADYSQIEIRILAELSGDENLIDDFRKRRDIHTMTAAKIFGVLPELVTKEMRRQAKTINFGILYGMGRYSLSRELKISTKEAENFINRYFENYPKVKEFREELINKARKDKFVTTYFGRKRYIYDIDSPDHNIRQNAERIAMNTPLQGTAADIVKKAMINVFKELTKRHIVFKMLLQVHDELLIEVEDVRMTEAMAVIQSEMENVVDFKVPLEVKIGLGKNWYEAAK